MKFVERFRRGDFVSESPVWAFTEHLAGLLMRLPTERVLQWVRLALLNRRLRAAQRMVVRHDPTATHDRGDEFASEFASENARKRNKFPVGAHDAS